jgi:Ca2+-transporting ATPase
MKTLKIQREAQKTKVKVSFLGLVGMIVRQGLRLKKAVELCKKAGIRVIMATGDQKLTAKAFGRDIEFFRKLKDY